MSFAHSEDKIKTKRHINYGTTWGHPLTYSYGSGYNNGNIYGGFGTSMYGNGYYAGGYGNGYGYTLGHDTHTHSHHVKTITQKIPVYVPKPYPVRVSVPVKVPVYVKLPQYVHSGTGWLHNYGWNRHYNGVNGHANTWFGNNGWRWPRNHFGNGYWGTYVPSTLGGIYGYNTYNHGWSW